MNFPKEKPDWGFLVIQVRAENKDAAEELAEALGLLAYNYCRRAGLSHEDAEEVAQDFAVRVISRLHQFDGRNFIGWAFEILRNLVIEHCRRRKRQIQALPLLEDDGDLAISASAQNGILTEAEHAALEEAMQQLKPKDRMLIESQIGSQRVPFEQIAGELGITEGNARLRHYRAKEYLEVILRKDARMKGWLARYQSQKPTS